MVAPLSSSSTSPSTSPSTSQSSRHQFVADPVLKEAKRRQQFLDQQILANPRYSSGDSFAGVNGSKSFGVALDPDSGRVAGTPAEIVAEEVEPVVQADFPEETAAPADEESRIAELQAALDAQSAEKDAELERAKAQAFAEGQAQGQLEAKEMLAMENDSVDAEIAVELRDLVGEMIGEAQSHLIAHQDLFDPLKTLALAMAEQIARCELTLSDDSLASFIQQTISEVDPLQLGELAIYVSNDWYKRLQRPELEGVFAAYSLRRDEALQPGSVRLALQDSSIHDLIEHRVAHLGEQLLSNAPPQDEFPAELSPADEEEAIFAGEFDDEGAIIQGDYSEVDDIFFQRPDED